MQKIFFEVSVCLKIVHFTHLVCHLLAVTGTALSCCQCLLSYRPGIRTDTSHILFMYSPKSVTNVINTKSWKQLLCQLCGLTGGCHRHPEETETPVGQMLQTRMTYSQ